MLKIVNEEFPANAVGIEKQTVVYTQDGDTNEGSDKYQLLKMETSCVAGGFSEKDNTDSFIRISIGDEEKDVFCSKHWSVESPVEFVEIFNDFAERCKMNVRWKIEPYYINNKNNN